LSSIIFIFFRSVFCFSPAEREIRFVKNHSLFFAAFLWQFFLYHGMIFSNIKQKG